MQGRFFQVQIPLSIIHNEAVRELHQGAKRLHLRLLLPNQARFTYCKDRIIIPFDIVLLNVSDENMPVVQKQMKDLVVRGLTTALVRMPPHVMANFDCDLHLDTTQSPDNDDLKGFSVLLVLKKRPLGVATPRKRTAFL
jgi:hypothetical protein